jgi:hypothetical protein
MRTKSFILGGVAVAALISITPAVAFTHHPGTAAEHQQTEDLNQQQLAQSQSTMPAPSAAPMSDQQASATTAAPTDQMAANAAPATGANTEHAVAPSAAPAGAVAQATPVDSLANPPQMLANASVESSSGQAVGAVQKVVLDASGKAKMVIVSLLGKVNKMVAIAANQLNFDQSRNVVVAQMSLDQINALPAAPRS